MTAERALSRTFAVGSRFRCTLTIPLAQGVAYATAEWEPEVPVQLSDAELADYRAGRAALLAEVAAALRGNVAVIEP